MKRALRQSSLKTYLFCPRSYQLRFLEDTPPQFRNSKALFGSAIHELIRQMHAGDWEMDIAGAYLQVFEDLEHGEEGEIPIRWKEEAKERAVFEEEALVILTGYREKSYNRDAEVLLAEAPFTLAVGKQVFTGTVDQVRKNPDGTIELVDFKTSRFAVSQSFLDVDVQMSLYAAALWRGAFRTGEGLRMLGVLPDRCTWYHLRHHIPYKRRTGTALAGDERGDPSFVTRRTEADLEEFFEDVRMIAEAIDRGLFPKNPNPMHCGFCAYGGACGMAHLAEPTNLNLKEADFA